MLQQLQQPQPERRSVPLQQKIQNRLPQRIVHGTVQLVAHQVLPLLAIGLLAAGVLPHFPQDQGVGLFGPGRLPDQPHQFVGIFIHHVQPPAVGAQPQPVPHHAVFPAQELPPALAAAVQLGQGGKAPPAFVVVGRGVFPAVPVPVGAVRIPPRAAGAVTALPVKIDAVAAGMVEHPVQDDLHPQPVRLLAQSGKVLLGPQQRVDAQVVGGIVAVVAVRFKDGVKVQDLRPQRPDLLQLFGDTGQISAEIIVAAVNPVGVRAALRLLVPAAVQLPVGGDILLFPAAFVVAVGEDLIHHPSGKAAGDLIGLFVDSQLPQRPVAVVGAAVRRAVQQGAVAQHKAVVVQSRLLRGIAQGKAVLLLLHFGTAKRVRLSRPVQQKGGRPPILRRQRKAQPHLLPRRHRAERGLIFRPQAVEHTLSSFPIAKS